MPEKPIPERVADCEKFESDLQTELEKHRGKFQDQEQDIKNLLRLFKLLVDSAAGGRDLNFAPGIRMPENAEAVHKFNELLDSMLKAKNLDG